MLTIDSDSDEPSLISVTKKSKNDLDMRLERIESNVEDVSQEIDVVKDVLHLNEGLKFHSHRLLRDTFQCKICLRTPLNPPVIMSKCCKTIIGCEACVLMAWMPF